MKHLAITILTIFSLSSMASNGQLLFEKATTRSLDYELKFDINKDLGRAWLVITEIDDSFEETDETDYRVKIDGLSFNKNSNEVVYTDENRVETICAVYKRRRFYSNIRSTNNCLIEKRYITVEHDDGFHIKKVLKVQFYLKK